MTDMAGVVKDEQKPSCEDSKIIQVTVKTLSEEEVFAVKGNYTTRQLKQCVAERLGTQTDKLVLIHSGRILSESEPLSQHKGQDGSVSLRMVVRPQDSTVYLSNDTEAAQSAQLTPVPDPAPDDLIPSPTSPLLLVEGLASLGLASGPGGIFSELQGQMQRQLLANPEMMCRFLGSSLVQGALCSSSPQLTRQLILDNSQTQQLLQTNPEIADMLNNPDVVAQNLELARNPAMMQEAMRNQDRALGNLEPALSNQESIPGDSNVLHRRAMDTQEPCLSPDQTQIGGNAPVTSLSGESQPITVENSPEQTPTFPPADPTAPPTADPSLTSTTSQNTTGGVFSSPGMQSLLQQITASPGLMETLVSGPYMSSLLGSLSQNPDLAAQMLLSNPLFSGNPQLQQQMKQQLPLFLQQMQSPEMLSDLLNPKAMQALLQIQQGLQTLVSEAPALIPGSGLGGIETSVNSPPELPSDHTPFSQSGNVFQVTAVTEQQQQFVQQMLQALANTNHQVQSEEGEFHEELDELSSMGFRDRQANLQALVNTGGDLTAAIEHLLNT